MYSPKIKKLIIYINIVISSLQGSWNIHILNEIIFYRTFRNKIHERGNSSVSKNIDK